VKKQLWGREFWTDGYFVSTVGKHGDENMIGKYVKNQGDDYQKLHEDRQLAVANRKHRRSKPQTGTFVCPDSLRTGVVA
jgi:hypothetical protein